MKKSLLEMFSYGIELRVHPRTNTVSFRFSASLDVDHELPIDVAEGEESLPLDEGKSSPRATSTSSK